MAEIVWKHGAGNDLLQIFSELEEYSEGAGARFVGKLDFTLNHLRVNPEMAPMLKNQSGALSLDQPATACSIPLKHAALLYTRWSI